LKSIAWELAKFFTKYPFGFVLPGAILISLSSMYAYSDTQSISITLSVFITLLVPVMYFAVMSDELMFFKIFGFAIVKISISDIFVSWKSTIKRMEQVFKDNDIEYFVKERFLDDVLVAFKNSEDSNFIKLIFQK